MGRRSHTLDHLHRADQFRCRLRLLLRQRDMSVAELARRGGFSPTAVYNFFAGRSHGFEFHTLLGIANALGMPLDALLGEAVGSPPAG